MLGVNIVCESSKHKNACMLHTKVKLSRFNKCGGLESEIKILNLLCQKRGCNIMNITTLINKNNDNQAFLISPYYVTSAEQG